MAYIITSRSQLRATDKPAPGSQIDWQHPLAQGLVGVYVPIGWCFGTTLLNATRKQMGNGSLASMTAASSLSAMGLYLSPQDDYVQIDNPGSLFDNTGLTIVARVFHDGALPAYAPRIADRVYNAPFAFYAMNGSNELSWAIKSQTTAVDRAANSTCPFTVSTWQNVALTYDGATVKAFNGGRIGDSASLSGGGLANSTNNIRIGQRVDPGSNRGWKGWIDHVYFWNKAIPDSHVSELAYSPYVFFWQPRRKVYFVAGGASPQTLTPDTATATAAASDVSRTATVTRTPDTATATAAASNASIAATITRTPDTATATAAASDAILAPGAVSRTPDTATATAAASDADIDAAVTRTPDTATATAAASDAIIAATITLTPDTAAATAAASEATIVPGVATVTPDTATATAEAFDATIVAANTPQTITPDTATATAAGVDAIIAAAITLTPDTATATASASEAGITATITLTPDPAAATAAASEAGIAAGTSTQTPGTATATATANDAGISIPTNQTITPDTATATAAANDCTLTLPPIVLPGGGGVGWAPTHRLPYRSDRTRKRQAPEKPKRKKIELRVPDRNPIFLTAGCARARATARMCGLSEWPDRAERNRLAYEAEIESDDMEAMRLLLDVL